MFFSILLVVVVRVVFVRPTLDCIDGSGKSEGSGAMKLKVNKSSESEVFALEA